MDKKLQIVPAILAVTEEEYRKKLDKIVSCKDLMGKWVQIDLMDNKFVQNTSINPEIIGRYPAPFKKEVHLMVNYPENWIDQLINVGIERIILPIEMEEGMEERIRHLKNHGVEVGLALNPQTPVAKVDPFIDRIDVVLVLSVEPGFGGQKFIPTTIDKVKQLNRMRQEGSSFLIEVDGGINETVVTQLQVSGADNLVIGSYLTDGNITENLKKIQQSLRSC